MPERVPTRSANQGAQPRGAVGSRKPGADDKAQQGEYQFLPVRCPNCGLEGKVKISRLDHTFTCKQCRKVFHVTLDGTVSGERPAEAPVDPTEIVVEEPPGWLAKRLESLPRAWQMGLLGLGGLLLAWGVSVWMEPVKPLPGELEDRAVFAAQALAHGEWKQMKRLAKPKTAGDLGRWFDKVRPPQWSELTAESGVEVSVLEVSQQVQKYEKDKPVVGALVTVKVVAAGKPEDSQLSALVLQFAQDGEAQWWLDGEKMLADFKPPKSAPKASKAIPKGVK